MHTHLCLLLSSCLGLFPLPGLLYLQQLSPISCFPLSTVFNLPISSFFPSALDFPGGPDGKVSVYNVGNPALIPGLGRSPGEGNGNPLQYYCTMPGKSHEQRSQVGYSPWGCKESDTTERLHFQFPSAFEYIQISFVLKMSLLLLHNLEPWFSLSSQWNQLKVWFVLPSFSGPMSHSCHHPWQHGLCLPSPSS